MDAPKRMQRTVTAFEVFQRMKELDDAALRLAPLSNIIKARAVKAGTKITIGWPGNIVGEILNDKFVGGLLLVDKARFDALKLEMEGDE